MHSRHLATKMALPEGVVTLPPEAIVLYTLKREPLVFIGEDHTDHTAKRLVHHIMPALGKIGAEFAWELVRSDDLPGQKNMRPGQAMMDRFIFKGGNDEEVREAITKHCIDYGDNMVEEKMAVLYSAREAGVRVIGIDNSNSKVWNRIETGNSHWEQVFRKRQASGTVRPTLALVGKFHLHRPNLYNEQAGDQADGIDMRLGATSIVVHSSEAATPFAWLGKDGLPHADIEIRIPKGYFAAKQQENTRFTTQAILEAMLRREEERCQGFGAIRL